MPLQDTMMRGSTKLRDIIADFFASTVPGTIDIMRLQNNLDEYHLPYPKVYNAVDPVQADAYPYMGSFITGISNIRPVEILPSGARRIQSNYQVTFFVAAATPFLGQDHASIPQYEKPYRDSSLRLRDDLVAVMMDAILINPSLGTAQDEINAVVDINTLDASLPEPMRADPNGPIHVCSGIISASVRFTESTAIRYLGNVNTIATTVDILEHT